MEWGYAINIWEDGASNNNCKISCQALIKTYDTKLEIIVKCRKVWSTFIYYDEDVLFRSR